MTRRMVFRFRCSSLIWQRYWNLHEPPMNGSATGHFALLDLAVCGAGRLASLTLAPSAARPSPPKITGNLAMRSVSVVSPTAHNALVEIAVVSPRIWVRYPLAKPPVRSQARFSIHASFLRSLARGNEMVSGGARGTRGKPPLADAVRQRDAPLRPVATDKVVLGALPVGKSRLVLIGNFLRPRRVSLSPRGRG